MKDFANAIVAIAELGPAVFVILAMVALAGWWIWVRAKNDRVAIASDGNRPATLFDLGNQRADMQNALSERTNELMDRLTDHERRISVLEGESDHDHRRPARK